MDFHFFVSFLTYFLLQVKSERIDRLFTNVAFVEGLYITRCQCFDHRLVNCTALLCSSMANTQRLVTYTGSDNCPMSSMGWCASYSYVQVLGAYNEALASKKCECVCARARVCVCVCVRERERV